MSDRRVFVIGAGPAGLAAAAQLERRGIRPTVLEQADAVGASWRSRYDRLRLNTPRWLSQLPGARYERGTGTFPPRDEMVRYLEAYAERHAPDIRFGTRMERIDRDGTEWILRTSAGDIRADHVIMASGHEHTPFIPEWPGRDRFEGSFLHAAEYRNPEPFRDGDVVVVGAGCSAMEIAYDVATGGARRVRLSVRTPPNIVLRSAIGDVLANMMLKLPPERADRVMKWVRRREVGDLTDYGLPEPEEGVFSRLRRLGVAPAIVDEEVLDAIRDRRIEVIAPIEELDETGALLGDDSRIEPDAVIAATGYRSGLEPLIGHLGVLDERGYPRVHLGEEVASGLRFIGYDPRPAQLGYLGGEARRAAREIARQVGPIRPRMRLLQILRPQPVR
jgi:putative flavoprotein involved in K+ transport